VYVPLSLTLSYVRKSPDPGKMIFPAVRASFFNFLHAFIQLYRLIGWGGIRQYLHPQTQNQAGKSRLMLTYFSQQSQTHILYLQIYTVHTRHRLMDD
jgi:hypothetical protein